MRHGFVRVAAATPSIRVADCIYNTEQIIQLIKKVSRGGSKVIVFPELCITGYTCGDLFLQEALLTSAKEHLLQIAAETASLDVVSVVGLPLSFGNSLYNCAAVVSKGKILGVVPKLHLPNYSEFYEVRHFASAKTVPKGAHISLGEEEVPFGTDLLFGCATLPNLILGVEICEDLWVPNPPSQGYALGGATLIINISASDEVIGKADYRRALVSGQSARLVSGYIYCDAGDGESTTDLVFSGHNLICENGQIRESTPFENGVITADVDIDHIINERRRITTFQTQGQDAFRIIGFTLKLEELALNRFIDPYPFVPSDEEEMEKRCDGILKMQANGLKKRLEHTGCKTVVLGLSGGLDSTLALLVCHRAFSMLSLPPSGIRTITMPCFGTTSRTRGNAEKLAQCLGVSFEVIPIEAAVLQHFSDIGHEADNYNVTYENGQARERTQILMNLANKYGGLVIGTGDLSELALGFATYNGDHMSMYGVNASIPKTLIRHLVRYSAETGEESLKKVLLDILDTPVSPELLPPDGEEIAQKTESIVGPYELHDFFLYQMMRLYTPPAKIFRLACMAFSDIYEPAFILKWLKMFYRRFFSQQFKRSCLPDGPKVGSVALSPRGDFRMPSDASLAVWQKELDQIII
jgi:NAD+ synthase (glutamine-hydrolysing)